MEREKGKREEKPNVQARGRVELKLKDLWHPKTLVSLGEHGTPTPASLASDSPFNIINAGV